MINKRTSHLVILLLILNLTLITGCTVKYVSDYDGAIKEEIVLVAKKVDLFWGNLLDTNAEERKYELFKETYNEIETDIRGLVMKNEIRPLNKESTRQAEILLNLWMEDKKIHKESDTFKDFIAKQHRRQYVRIFTAMAKGEEAKKNSPE